MFERLAYALGARLGSGMRGQRAQIEDWRQSAANRKTGGYPGQGSELREMFDSQRQLDATVQRVYDQRRAQADILQAYESPRTVPGFNYTENRRCTNPDCWCGQ